MAKNRKQPKPIKRQAFYIDPDARDAVSKAIAIKSRRMIRQGKLFPGLVHPHYKIRESGQPRVGVQIGKKAFIFELRGSKPIVIGSQEKIGGAAIRFDNTFKGVAELRKEFAGLPKIEREAVLKKVRTELLRLFKETPPEERREFINNQEEFRTMEPKPGHISNVDFGLKYSKTVGELDVVWEFWSRNEIIKKRYEKMYFKKRRELQNR